MIDNDPMPKSLAEMTHVERMAAIMRELHSSTSLSKADELVQLIQRELQEAVAVRAMAASRHGGTAAPDVPTITIEARPPAASSHQALGTMGDLIESYKTHEDSPFGRISHASRLLYVSHCGRIAKDLGDHLLSQIRPKDFDDWYEQWVQDSGKSTAHGLVTMLRGLLNFGMKVLDDRNCERLAVALRNLRIEGVKRRTERLTNAQVDAIRAKAHEMGRPSIALAQAIQWDLKLKQIDVIGQWVPESERGEAYYTHAGQKWQRGVRWEEVHEIDGRLILRHVTTYKNKNEEVDHDLSNAPMVLAELAMLEKRLGKRPTSGAMVLHDYQDRPWGAYEFRRLWRLIAKAAGVPKSVKNMDSVRSADKRQVRASDDGDESKKDRPASAHSQPAGQVH